MKDQALLLQDGELLTLFKQERLLTLSEIQHALETKTRMTVYRRLKPLGYKTSYSHSGRYYTLDQLAQYDANGIWEVDGILFSKHGTLL